MKTALVIVDMQNAFCSRTGSFSKRGFRLIGISKVIKNIQKLIHAAEKNKWLIVFTKLTLKKDYSDAGLLVKCSPEIIKLKAYREKTPDSEIISDLKPKKTDIIVSKKRYDPFVGTNLGKVLKKRKIKRLIVAGVTTNVCVESTIRSAFDRDFEVILVKDATTTYSKTLQKASVTTLTKHFALVTTTNALKVT